jgi:hypothetical protein
LKAGYSDGYAGRNFRAVAEFRSLSASLNVGADPRGDDTYFDNGVRAGYAQGLDHAPTSPSSSELDFHVVTCPETNLSGSHAVSQRMYCAGYQRGYVLGRTDGMVLGPDRGLLEASR